MRGIAKERVVLFADPAACRGQLSKTQSLSPATE